MKLIQITFLSLFLFFGCDNENEKQHFEFTVNNSTVTLPKHPRLFFSAEEEQQIMALTGEEPLLQQLIDMLQLEADQMLSLPPQQPGENGAANLGKSREQIARMITLSLAYRLFDDDRYALKAEQELLNVCGFKSWHPEHFLDVAEMTTAVAIGYDWCFDKLSAETKEVVENSIMEKAFAPAWKVYEDGDEGSWAKRNTNWNVVCNSGLVNGALAIAEKYPADAARIIQYAIQYTPNNIKHFAPNGVYYEGPAYWDYTCSYLMLLLDNLDRNLGSGFGLPEMPGVSETAKYYIQSLSPSNRVFNFADAHGTEATYTPVYFFWSRYFNQPEVAEFYRNYLQNAIDPIVQGEFSFPRFFFLSIPWFDKSSGTDKLSSEKLKVFEGEPDILVFNGHASIPDELYLIAKGGDPDMAHNQLDVGSFIVESQQIRWGIDLGSDSYSLPSFWDYKPDGIRWHYFRNTNLAHNTLNIDGKIAYSRGAGFLKNWNENSEKPFGVFDLTSFYNCQAASVWRGFRMLAPDIILCRDEAILEEGAEFLNWRFISDAEVVKRENYIELSKDGKSFYLLPVSEDKEDIKVFEAKTNTPGEMPLTGVSVIEIAVKPGKDDHVFVNVLMGENLERLREFSREKMTPINEWN